MKTKINILTASAAVLCALTVTTAHADTFGTTGNEFTIDFVTIGNAGNGDDATGNTYTADGGNYGSGTSFGLGGVSYDYRIGLVEVSQDAITKATASGLLNVTAGAWTGSQPAAMVTWYEAAAVVNFLNTSTGHQAAYSLSQIPPDSFGNTWSMTLWSAGDAWQLGGQNLYRHKDAYYFLPSEDEWYKAAYHKNDGVTANYWDYATGSNSIPTAVASGIAAGTAVYNGVTSSPAAVDIAGGLSAYGTMGQNGNVFEQIESALDGTNDLSSEIRTVRGGLWDSAEDFLRSSGRATLGIPFLSGDNTGFRVASVVPEPSSIVASMLGLGVLALRRRRQVTF